MCQIGDWQRTTFASTSQGLAGWRWFNMEEYRGHRGKKVRLTALYAHDGVKYPYKPGINTTQVVGTERGFWSYRTAGLARQRGTDYYHVLARVSLSGRVEWHTRGYRSERLKIEALYPQRPREKPWGMSEREYTREWQRQLALAAKTYKVKVEVKVVKPKHKPVFA